jgi:outer membrane lipase/esterase
MLRRVLASGLLIAFWASAATAQNFSQSVTLGDSTVDSGNYKNGGSGSATFDAAIAAAIAQGGQAKPGGPGLMVSEALAGYFGLSANPTVSGGTNYATSGARAALTNDASSGLFQGAVPVTTQISSYLASTGTHANSSALYFISVGGNDVTFAANTYDFGVPADVVAATNYLTTQANALVGSIQALQAAGGRYIVVPNLARSLGNAEVQAYRGIYSDAVWNGLVAAGVKFIPADFNAVRVTIQNNAALFGFTSIAGGVPGTGTQSACQIAAASPINNAWGLACAPVIGPPAGNVATLTSATATQTSLFADDQHFAAAGQKIFADYYYSLVVAPSQISMLAEAAVKSRAGSGLVGAIQNQLPISLRPRSTPGWNAWVSGDTSRLEFDNFDGFPSGRSDSNNGMLVAGADYSILPGTIFGVAGSAGRLSLDYKRSDGRNGGGFDQDEYTVSAYLASVAGPWRFDVIGTYGRLDYDVTRNVPLGIADFVARGDTDGTNWSVAATAGYDFRMGALRHGPFAGLTWQHVHIDGFTETSSGPVALSFGDQTRSSLVSALGYRMSWEAGMFRPFASIAWKHEFADQDREVTATLTTTVAPSYSLPAINIGRDWLSASVGTTVELGGGLTLYGAVNGSFLQDDAQKYGAQLGLSVKF